jgi:type IV secretory pathway VirJ component
MALVLVGATCLAGCVRHLLPEPGLFEVRREQVRLPDSTLKVTYVTPAAPHHPAFLILFVTGDAGWQGASMPVFKHMARQGYYVAAYNSRQALKITKQSGKNLTLVEGTVDLTSIIDQARRALGLPAETLTILTGVSRGASMVVFGAANKKMQPVLAGAVAVALTREADYLGAPGKSVRMPGIERDEKGQIQLYPAIDRVGALPFAVIQSTGDKYVPAVEARQLFGPDTQTRRLYTVEASNHGFGGGRDQMMLDLDDALTWITSRPNGHSLGTASR